VKEIVKARPQHSTFSKHSADELASAVVTYNEPAVAPESKAPLKQVASKVPSQERPQEYSVQEQVIRSVVTMDESMRPVQPERHLTQVSTKKDQSKQERNVLEENTHEDSSN
jgi:hypothetical protein